MGVVLLWLICPALVVGMGVNCPYERCDCFEETISCNFDELTSLPEVLPVSVTTLRFLNLNNNKLTNIQAGRLPADLYGIDFQQNPITTIDENAFDDNSNTLTDLTFSQAHFSELPPALGRLNALKHLIIGDTEIRTWNVTILKHIGLTLQTLLLTNVGLTEWPSWIQYLSHLGTLELSDMTLTVPDHAFDNQINTLFSLNLENTSLTGVPSAVSRLTMLQYLVLEGNSISNVTLLPASQHLVTLSLDKNRISDAEKLSKDLLPVAGALTSLDLMDNKLHSLPDLSAMTRLETLYLSRNPISFIGASKMPSSLKFLWLESNNLPSIYNFMQTGTNLTSLKLMINLIKDIRGVDIPPSVSDMDLTSNLITELTDTSFPPNSAMMSLQLDLNPISKISPVAFISLNQLSYLSLQNTKLTRLPVSLGVLTNLRTVDLSRNTGLVCTCLEKTLRKWSLQNHPVINGDCGILTVENFLNVLSSDCPT